MLMSPDCRKQIVEPAEGLRLRAYRDCVGVLTIGYGHTSRAGVPTVRPGMVISQAQADDILSGDLAIFANGVSSLLRGLSFTPEQREFDAICDLAFNVGLGAVRSSSLLSAYRRGDKATTARKFMDWTRAGGRIIPGLVTRRRRDAAWFLDGAIQRTTVMPILGEESGDMAHVLDHPDNVIARAWYGWRAPKIDKGEPQ